MNKTIQVPVDELPEVDGCVECRGAGGITVAAEMTASYISTGWLIWCGCGKSTDAHAELVEAVLEWNQLMRRLRAAQYRKNFEVVH